MNGIESLLKTNTTNDKWLPIKVQELDDTLSNGDFYNLREPVKKNILYSLQYLQYLQLQLGELRLTSVLMTQIWKSYIIISIGIIEAICEHLLLIHGKIATVEWEEFGKKIESKAIQEDESTPVKYIITKKRKLDSPKLIQMDFDRMLAKVRSLHLLKISQDAYPYIRELKSLRNRVHLQNCSGSTDTDYWKISSTDYYLARYCLYRILTDDVFCKECINGRLDWIDLNAGERTAMVRMIKSRRK